MSPLIQDGDFVIVELVENPKIHVGEIYWFKQNGEFTAHRAIKHRGCVTFKGDRSLYADDGVDRIMGRVVGIERGNKKVDLNKLSYLNRVFFFSSILGMKSKFVRYLGLSLSFILSYLIFLRSSNRSEKFYM